jgi:hypothetical protein
MTLLAAALVLSAQQTYDLSWKPEVGKVSVYDINLEAAMDIPGAGPMDIEVELNVSSKVAGISKGLVTVEEEVKAFQIYMDGNPMDIGGGPAGQGKDVKVFKMNGEVVSHTPAPSAQDNPRMDQANVFRYPPKPLAFGDSWTRDVKSDPAKGIVQARAKYTLEGKEKALGIDCYKIKYAYSELEGDQPTGSLGNMWFSVKEMEFVLMEAEMNDVILQPGIPPTHAQFRMALKTD